MDFLGRGLDDCGLSGVEGGALGALSSSKEVHINGDTSSLRDGGLTGIQAGCSDDSEDDGDFGDITAFPLEVLEVWFKLRRSLKTGRSCILFLACSLVLQPL